MSDSRCFIIKEGESIATAKDIAGKKVRAREVYLSIANGIGAEESYYQRDGLLTGFIFDKKPDSRFKKMPHGAGWMPKKNSKFGKDIYRRLKDVEYSENSILTQLGFCLMMFDIPHMRYAIAQIIPFPSSPVVLIKLPWKSTSPARLAEASIDGGGDDILRYMVKAEETLAKHPEIKEVEEWQIKEVIDDYNFTLEY